MPSLVPFDAFYQRPDSLAKQASFFNWITSATPTLIVKQAEAAYAPPATGPEEDEMVGGFSQPKESVLAAITSMIENELKTGYAYRAYAQAMRGVSRGDIADDFEEHADEETEHAEYLMRRAAVMGGSLQLPDIPAPPASTDPLDIIRTMLRIEQEGAAKWRLLHSMIEDSNPMRFKVEEYMTREEEHQDDLKRYLPEEETNPPPPMPLPLPPALGPLGLPPGPLPPLGADLGPKLASEKDDEKGRPAAAIGKGALAGLGTGLAGLGGVVGHTIHQMHKEDGTPYRTLISNLGGKPTGTVAHKVVDILEAAAPALGVATGVGAATGLGIHLYNKHKKAKNEEKTSSLRDFLKEGFDRPLLERAPLEESVAGPPGPSMGLLDSVDGPLQQEEMAQKEEDANAAAFFQQKAQEQAIQLEQLQAELQSTQQQAQEKEQQLAQQEQLGQQQQQALQQATQATTQAMLSQVQSLSEATASRQQTTNTVESMDRWKQSVRDAVDNPPPPPAGQMGGGLPPGGPQEAGSPAAPSNPDAGGGMPGPSNPEDSNPGGLPQAGGPMEGKLAGLGADTFKKHFMENVGPTLATLRQIPKLQAGLALAATGLGAAHGFHSRGPAQIEKAQEAAAKAEQAERDKPSFGNAMRSVGAQAWVAETKANIAHPGLAALRGGAKGLHIGMLLGGGAAALQSGLESARAFKRIV